MHAVKRLLDQGEDGPLFEGISAPDALKVLRLVLAELSVKDAVQYRTHDFRRGHAQDLVESGMWYRLA